MNRHRLLSLVLLLIVPFAAPTQDRYAYSRHDAFSVSAGYSNTSSHIILGVSQNRRIAALNLSYSRRLLHSRSVAWYYDLDLHPLTFIQDPTATFYLTSFDGFALPPPQQLYFSPIQHACASGSYTVTTQPGPGFPPDTFTFDQVCGTRWTYAAGLSPLGQRVNFRLRHRLQPFVAGNAGFLLSRHDLPANDTSRFNFTFEFGAGLEFFRDHTRSWTAEYRLQHLSNGYLGNNNPGIDSQVIRVGYSFGR